MAVKPPKEQPLEPLSFEATLKRLEEIVHRLEEGEMGLNEALAHYEEGIKLLRQSYQMLDRAERQIELLCGVDADGNPICQPIDDQSTLSTGPKAQRHGSRRAATEDS